MDNNREIVPLTLYSRVGCSLCDQMIAELNTVTMSKTFDITVVDIDQDAILQQKFTADVPVLAHKKEIICVHFLDTTLLEAFLEAHT